MNRLYRWIERHDLIDVARALRYPGRAVERFRAQRWSDRVALSLESTLEAVDPDLWSEACDWVSAYAPMAEDRLSGLEELRIGTGHGLAAPTYFVTRYIQPAVAVETGVAAGWTTAAILAAMRVNQRGHLWSSELPHDRPWIIDDYTPYVGIVVEESLRDRWTLFLAGDRENLPHILQECGEIDFFCYDSDKTVDGREFALSLVAPRLAADAAVIVDDVADNLHFRRWMRVQSGVVLRRPGSFIGLTGPWLVEAFADPLGA